MIPQQSNSSEDAANTSFEVHLYTMLLYVDTMQLKHRTFLSDRLPDRSRLLLLIVAVNRTKYSFIYPAAGAVQDD